MFSKYDPKQCANCGKPHICTGTVHCPCFEVEVQENLLDYIAANFDECLCNDCIEELIKRLNQNNVRTRIFKISE